MGVVRFFERLLVRDDYRVERTFQSKGLKYIRSEEEKLGRNCKRAIYKALMFCFRIYLTCSFLKIRILEYKKPAPTLKERKDLEELEEAEGSSDKTKLAEKPRRARKRKCLKCYCLTVDNPFTLSDLKWCNLFKKLLKAFVLLSLFYITFKLFTIAFLKLRYDSILEAYAPRIIINGTIVTSGSKCALPQHISSNLDKFYDNQYKEIEEWLVYLGDPIISLTGVGSIIASLFAMISIFFFIGPYIYIFFLKYGAIVPMWAFLKEPVRMRDKVRYDLNGLCKKIKNTLEHGGNLFDKELTEELTGSKEQAAGESTAKNAEDQVDPLKQARKSVSHRKDSLLLSIGFDESLSPEVVVPNYDPVAIIAKKREKFSNFVAMLQDIKACNVIEPANSTANYHRGSIGFYLIFSVWPILQGFALGCLTLAFMIYNEIDVRVTHRLGLLECDQQLEGSVPIKNHIKLKPFASFEDEWAYTNHDPNSLYSCLLLAYIEAKYFYLDSMVLLSLLEYITIFFLSTFWIALLANLFLASHTNSLVWLNQIEDQVIYCTNLVEVQIKAPANGAGTPGAPYEPMGIAVVGERNKPETNSSLSSSSPLIKIDPANGRREEDDEPDNDDDDDIEDDLEQQQQQQQQPEAGKDSLPIDDKKMFRLVAITYLNFELFRAQHRGQQGFMNFLLLLIVFNTIIPLYFCYMANKNIQPNYMKFLLFEATTMVLVLNIYLISGSLLTAKILGLMKRITKLIVLSNYKKHHCEHNILELWRRQVMSDTDAKKSFAASFLGIFVTFDKLITVNSWLVLLWMFLLFRAPETAVRQAPGTAATGGPAANTTV